MTPDALSTVTTRYGRQAAAWIVEDLATVPAAARQVALDALLDAIDPQIGPAVAPAIDRLRATGLAPAEALERALAQVLGTGMALELEAAGQRVRRGQPAFTRRGQLALRTPAAQATAQYDALHALGLSIGSIGRAIGGAAKKVGGGLADGGRAAADFVQRGAKRLGGMACTVISDDAAIAAITVANPVAGAGTMAARGSCPQPKSTAPSGLAPGSGGMYAAPARPRTLPSWALPAAAVAGGALLLLILTRKARP